MRVKTHKLGFRKHAGAPWDGYIEIVVVAVHFCEYCAKKFVAT